MKIDLTANGKFRLNGVQFWDIERCLFMENDLRTTNRKSKGIQWLIAFEYPIIPDGRKVVTPCKACKI